MNKGFREFLETIGINITLVLAGLIGSLIMVSGDSAKNIKSSLLGIASGTLLANYVTPLVVESLGLGDKSQFGIAFLLGYFGLKGVEKFAGKYFDKK